MTSGRVRLPSRILGEINGVRSDVLAFVRPYLPAWLRIWVGVKDGLVRREQMSAEGAHHDHTYSGLNSQVSIAPPG